MMLCQDCNEREATIHLTQVINNQKKVLNLCETCAEIRGFSNPLKNIPFPLGDFLSSMVEKAQAAASGSLKQIVCDGCGLTFAAFSKTGRFGCGKCYEAFHPQLDDLLRKIHGSNRHVGRMPAGSPEKMAPIRRELKLKEQLREAVESEDFELAAELRDRLKEMVVKEH